MALRASLFVVAVLAVITGTATEAVAAGRVPAGGTVRAKALAPSRGALRQAPRPRLPVRRGGLRAYRAAKAAASRRRAASNGRARSRSAAPRAGVFGSLNAPGLDANDGGGATPPDTTGSIGPSHYVQMVNSAIGVYGRSNLGLLSGPQSLEQFMAAPGTTLVTDPQIEWDQQGQRWIYAASAFEADPVTDETVGPNFLLLGFSKTSNPADLAGGWCRYAFPSGSSTDGNLFDDYPKLGHDDTHLLVGTNAYPPNPQAPAVTARLYSVPKPGPAPLSSCPSTLAATVFGSEGAPLRTSDNDLAFTPVPANTADSSAAGYVVAADDPVDAGSPRNQLMAWHVAGSGAAPSLVPDGNTAVLSYDVPPPANQPGATTLDTLDARLTMAVAHADPGAGGAEAVWTQHAVDPGDGSVVMRWYELLPASRAVRNQGNISAPGLDVFNGAVSPSSAGDIAGFSYNVSGLTLAPEIRASSRNAATPAGATQDEITLGTSGSAANDLNCDPLFGCRWGDYSGASPDNANSTVVWGSNQAVAAPGGPNPTWVTRNFAIAQPPPPPPQGTGGGNSTGSGGTTGTGGTTTGGGANPSTALATRLGISIRGVRGGGVISSYAHGTVRIQGNRAGQSLSTFCGGRVRIAVRRSRRGRTVARRAATVSRSRCSWSRRFVFPLRRLTQAQRRILARGETIRLYASFRYAGSSRLRSSAAVSRRYRVNPHR